jgi:hypothetical protein
VFSNVTVRSILNPQKDRKINNLQTTYRMM